MSRLLLTILFVLPTMLMNADGVNGVAKVFKKEGYIINNDGEKVNGHLILRRDKTYDEVKVKFVDHNGKKFTYKATDIKEFAFRDIQDDEFGNRVWKWNYYASRKVDESPIPFGPKEVFMERIAEGNVTLYQYWIQHNRNIENPYRRVFYLERGDERVKLTEENFVEEASAFFSDNEDISMKMGQVNHRFRHMKRVVDTYNFWHKRQYASNS